MAEAEPEPKLGEQEELIRLIERHPWLYDTSRGDYRLKDKKDNAWEAIAHKMGLKGEEGIEECKKRWKQIRDRYVKERKKVKGRSGAGREDVEKPTWVLYKYLLFLEGQIRHRRSMTVKRAANGAQTDEPGQGGTEPAPQEILMGIYEPQASEMVHAEDEEPETPLGEIGDDSDDDLQPSATSAALQSLVQRHQTPTLQQLTPPPLQRSAAANADPGPEQGSPPATLHHRQSGSGEGRPPAAKRRASCQQSRAQEELGIRRLLEESTRQMANVCTRPHLDLANPSVAFAMHIAHEVSTLAPHHQSGAKFALSKALYEFQEQVKKD